MRERQSGLRAASSGVWVMTGGIVSSGVAVGHVGEVRLRHVGLDDRELVVVRLAGRDAACRV